jgi:hypothetical protein
VNLHTPIKENHSLTHYSDRFPIAFYVNLLSINSQSPLMPYTKHDKNCAFSRRLPRFENFASLKKGNFNRFKTEILTVLRKKILTVWKGKFW